jgi:hypothetical protein
MVVIFVNHLKKYLVIIPMRDTITTKKLILLFLIYIMQHVGILDTVVSNRDPQFVSDFWNEFCTHIGTKLKLSTVYYLQTDSQMEIVN